MNFFNVITKSTRPLPYTKPTPIEERKKFIKHLYENGFTVYEIMKVYPQTSWKRINQIINE